MVRIINDGRISLKAIRIWIKDDLITIDEPMNPGEAIQMGPYTVDLVSGTSYPVTVTTERGNIFTTSPQTLEPSTMKMEPGTQPH